jgi:hypothetical protein
MKFSVLEYTSKSGKIWQHTPLRPNYLANPQTEIDPTSFGCYVSALKGQHIPLTHLALANFSKPRKAFKRLTKKFPPYSLKFLQQFDALLAVHQLSDAHELVRALNRLQQLSPRPLIIGVPTQPYGLLKPALDNNPKAKQDFVGFMKACDHFISVVKSTVGYYESLSSTPVTYLPQPYPASYASQFKSQEKNQTILVAGVTQRDNIKQGHRLAVFLQNKFPDYQILIPKVTDLDYDFSLLKNSNYQVLDFEPWQQHLKTLATTKLVINTDYTQTRGRVQTDCAAVGTPSLGGNSDGQVDLFPKLASTLKTTNQELIKKAEQLLVDQAYYQETVNYASDKLKKYDYQESAARFQLLVKTIS